MSIRTYSVLVIGAGLIGGSVIKAIVDLNNQNANCVFKIDIYEPFATQDIVKYCNQYNISFYNQESFVKNKFDIIIIATPPKNAIYNRLVNELNIFELGKEVCELSSVKSWLTDIEAFKNAKNLFSLHIMAGKSQSGFIASDANLFVNKKVIHTKLNSKQKNLHNSITKDLFSRITKQKNFVELSTKDHDMICALCSHLPQWVSFDIANRLQNDIAFANTLHPKLMQDFKSKTGFFRLCESDVNLWNDIFTLNQKHLNDARRLFNSILHTKYLKDSSNATNYCLAVADTFNTFFKTGKYAKDILHLHGSGFETIISLACLKIYSL